MMNKVLQASIGTCAFVYIDDIVIMSDNFEDHMKHLHQVLSALKEANLKTNIDKCHFCLSQLKLLGKIVSSKGITVDPDLITDMVNYTTPRTISQVRQFLAFLNHYSNFVPNFQVIAEPLYRLLRKNIPWTWREEIEEKAFKILKDAMCNTPVLLLPDWNKEFYLQTDASKIGAGAVLLQKDDQGSIRPVSFASWLFNPAQRNYSTTERELLAIVKATRKWKPYLYMRKFLIETDHKPLQGFWNLDDPYGKLARWSSELNQFDFSIKYIKGSTNVQADSLSRHWETIAAIQVKPQRPSKILANLSKLEDLEKAQEITAAFATNLALPNDKEWAEEQRKDPELYPIIRWLEKEELPEEKVLSKEILKSAKQYALDLDKHNILMRVTAIKKGSNVKIARRVVPSNWRKLILSEYHDSIWVGSHMGVRKTYERIKEKFFFKNMEKYITLWVKTCPKCQAIKDPKDKSKSPMGKIESHFPWDLVCMDLWGPITQSRSGNEYVLTVIDAFSKFAFMIPIPRKEAEVIAQALWIHIFHIFGSPRRLHSDRGSEFVNSVLKGLALTLNIHQSHTTAYHPQGNAYAERLHKFLRCAVAAYVREDLRNWDELLPGITLAYNNHYHDSTGCSPAEAFLGRRLNAPNEIIDPPTEPFTTLQFAERLKYTLAKIQNHIKQRVDASILKRNLNMNTKITNFEIGQLVAIYDPRKIKGRKIIPQWNGPLTIEHKSKDGKVFYLKDQYGISLNVPICKKSTLVGSWLNTREGP
jgi:hypothetical protein